MSFTGKAAFDLQGHRGARGHAPENTLPGFERALAFGVATFELDVGISRDGVVAIHHDRRLNPDLARGPDGGWVAAPTPLVRELTFAELQRYDVGRIRPGSEYERRFPHQQPADGARIPALSDLLARYRSASVRFNIELKLLPEAPDEALSPEPFARAVVAVVRSAGMQTRCTLQSFDWRAVKAVEREAPEIATAYLTEEADSDPRKVAAAGARTWSPDFRALSEATVAAARRLGLKLIPWTVNEPVDIRRMLELGVDGIISDYPDRVTQALEIRKRSP
ncbi:MAG TPA: glycerophosphodiester phosphodiesterase [Burkholderiales bacterium]|jgi:glycerophosphoryl diester phosphodiesterase